MSGVRFPHRPHMKNFEKLQARLELMTHETYQKNPRAYKILCDIILIEEGWSEEEYMGAVLSRIDPKLFS